MEEEGCCKTPGHFSLSFMKQKLLEKQVLFLVPLNHTEFTECPLVCSIAQKFLEAGFKDGDDSDFQINQGKAFLLVRTAWQEPSWLDTPHIQNTWQEDVISPGAPGKSVFGEKQKQ